MFRQAVPAVLRSAVETAAGAIRAAGSLPKTIKDDGLPTITEGRQAFEGDLRATSGVGLGDGITGHTGKWLQGDARSPMEMLKEEPPIKVSGLRVASRGGDDPSLAALGCPVEYIDLRGSTPERPAVCKYTGNKYYSDDWKHGGGAH